MKRLSLFTAAFLLGTGLYADKTSDLAEKSANDPKARTALRNMAHDIAEKGDSAARLQHAKSLVSVLEKSNDHELKAYLIRELQYVGKQEAVPALVKLLSSEKLCSQATQALLGIAQQVSKAEISKAISSAFLKSSGKTAVGLGRACGSLRISDSAVLKKIVALSSSSDWDVKRTAYRAIAHIGSAGYNDFFSKAISSNKNYQKSYALQMNFLYLRQLSDKQAAAKTCRLYISKLQDQKNAPFLINALSTLIELDSSSADEVLKYLEHPNPRIRTGVARVLKYSDSKAVRGASINRRIQHALSNISNLLEL